jgi:uncharacterized protein YuzE
MKVTYDETTDTLTVVLTEAPVPESDENEAGVILDYDADGNLAALEILDVSKRVNARKKIEDKELAERLRLLQGSLKGTGALQALMEEKRREREL